MMLHLGENLLGDGIVFLYELFDDFRIVGVCEFFHGEFLAVEFGENLC